MKKFLVLTVIFIAFIAIGTRVFATNNMKFSQAIRTCEEFSQNGTISRNGEVFKILVTLDKSGKNKCIYKEKIYQEAGFQQLNCTFYEDQLGFLADSMERYYKAFPLEMAKNKIFEAKMTTNGEIFNKYLANPKYCKITESRN